MMKVKTLSRGWGGALLEFLAGESPEGGRQRGTWTRGREWGLRALEDGKHEGAGAPPPAWGASQPRAGCPPRETHFGS